MRLTRVRGSELVACLCGAALLASLSLDWFDAGSEPASGWSSLGFVDAFLALTGGLAVGLPLLSASQEKTDLTITATAIICFLAMLGLVMLVYRVLDPPASSTPEAGVFVGLAACLGISLSTWRAMADDGTARAAA